MESPKEPVIYSYRTIVTNISSNDSGFPFFCLDGISALFFVDHTFSPGDHVKITITKEPLNAQPS